MTFFGGLVCLDITYSSCMPCFDYSFHGSKAKSLVSIIACHDFPGANQFARTSHIVHEWRQRLIHAESRSNHHLSDFSNPELRFNHRS